MEAGDFTSWLAENLDVFADELGLVLTGAATEVPVGSFYLDIRAETEDGRPAARVRLGARGGRRGLGGPRPPR